ncbi:MAG: hypothetical protein JW740_03260 [Candidatus Zambryskibacteria bacterium]|nr:hypothetical protein [Candidatus Zambryskibacteria bacterium]
MQTKKEKHYPNVEAAIIMGDHAKLSTLGTIGGIRSGEARRAKRDTKLEAEEELQQIRKEEFNRELLEKLNQANEIVCPPPE